MLTTHTTNAVEAVKGFKGLGNTDVLPGPSLLNCCVLGHLAWCDKGPGNTWFNATAAVVVRERNEVQAKEGARMHE